MTSTIRSTHTGRRRRAHIRHRRLAFERCEPRQMLATDLAWAIPQSNVNDVEVDSAGNVFIATDNGIGKYSPDGTLIWGRSTPYAYSLSISLDGEICVGGYFQSSFAFGPGPEENQINSAGATDIFVAKFDGAGQCLWARGMGGTGDESANGVDFDQAGNIVFTGNFKGVVDFDPGLGTYLLSSSAGNQDTFIAKLDSAGNFLWADALLGSADWDFGDDLTCDSQGNVIVVGRFYLQADFDPGPGTAFRSTSAGSDGFVLKLDSDGGFVWVDQLSASFSLNGVFGIVVDDEDNIYATGEFRGAVDFDPGPGVYPFYTTSSNADYFLWNLSPSGELIWAKTYSSAPTGPGDSDYAFDLARDDAGDLYVTGYFGNSRAFISQFDSAGNPLRIREMTGGYCYGNAIDVDSSGNVYVGGYAGSAANYPGAANQIISPPGFLLRVNPFEPNATLQGRAWNDLNANGIQDPGEPGLADVPVQLVRSLNTTFGDSDDIIVGNATTSGEGSYRFEHLDWVYNYFVVASAPAGFSSSGIAGTLSVSPMDQGGDDSLDNDLNPAIWRTAAIALNPAQAANADLGFRGSLPGFGWASRTAATSDEVGKFIAQDSAGNVYVLGTKTSGVIDFDPGPSTMNSLSGAGFILIKYSKSGAFQWVREITSSTFDTPVGLVVDEAGCVYVAGKFSSTSSCYFGFGTSQQKIDNSNTSGVQTVGVFKIDTQGSLVWNRLIRPSSGSIFGSGLTIDAQNNLYLMGEFTGSLTLSTAAPGSPALITNSGAKDVYLTKMNTAGDFLWWKMLDSNSQVTANSIAIDAAGNVYASGTFSGSLDFDPSAAVHSLTGSNSTFIAKLTAEGDYIWAEQIGRTIPAAMATTSNGVLLTGSFSGTVDFDPSPEVQANFTSSVTSAFVLNLNGNGEFVWARSLALTSGTLPRAGGTGIAVDQWGNAYVVGSFSGTADFDPGAGVASLSATNGYLNAFLWKLTSQGSYLSANAFGAADDDSANAITVDPIGNAWFTGSVKNSVDFDPTTAIFSPISTTTADLFVAAWYNPAPPPAGDFNGDGNTDAADFNTWQTNFPKNTAASILDGDADGDGDVDGADFIAWQVNFVAAGEPAAMASAAAGSANTADSVDTADSVNTADAVNTGASITTAGPVNAKSEADSQSDASSGAPANGPSGRANSIPSDAAPTAAAIDSAESDSLATENAATSGQPFALPPGTGEAASGTFERKLHSMQPAAPEVESARNFVIVSNSTHSTSLRTAATSSTATHPSTSSARFAFVPLLPSEPRPASLQAPQPVFATGRLTNSSIARQPLVAAVVDRILAQSPFYRGQAGSRPAKAAPDDTKAGSG